MSDGGPKAELAGGFEYKVVPAPNRGTKMRGVKGTPARFALTLETVMNELGAEGWDYLRADTLPVEERQGLTGKTTTFQTMLVFRRRTSQDVAPVAALIEDHTFAPALQGDDEAADGVTTLAQTRETEEMMPEDLLGTNDAADDPESGVADAPFVFPWNKRKGAAHTPQTGSQQDDAAPKTSTD